MNFYKTEADATITNADFQLPFPDAQLYIEPTTITISQHCQVTIALGTSAELSPFGPLTEIGISKYSCWLCEVFFKCLGSKSGHKFGIGG